MELGTERTLRMVGRARDGVYIDYGALAIIRLHWIHGNSFIDRTTWMFHVT